MNRTAAGRLGVCVKSLTAGCLCVLLFLVGCNGVLAPETALESAGAILSLEDVLTSDPLDSPAACSNVEFGNAAPGAGTVGGAAPLSRLVPPNPDGLTPVDILVFVIAIDNIDTMSNSFRFEGYGGLIWCDPRLAAEAAPMAERVVFGDSVEDRLGKMWWPGVFLPSQLGEPERSSERVIIYPDGTVLFSAKFNSRMLARYDFSRFPLDRQFLRIPIQTSVWHSDVVALRQARGQVGFNRGFDIPEWNVEGFSTRVDVVAGSRGRVSFSRFVMEIEIGRRIGFYLWKILTPLLLIVGVGWCVFWMSRENLAQRQRTSATAVLTIVAFQFVASAQLPRVPYLTLMDGVLLWSFFAVAATLILNVINARRFRNDHEAGLRADRRMRWLFPVAYFVGLILITVLRFLR
jgi:hypothetical protein